MPMRPLKVFKCAGRFSWITAIASARSNLMSRYSIRRRVAVSSPGMRSGSRDEGSVRRADDFIEVKRSDLAGPSCEPVEA